MPVLFLMIAGGTFAGQMNIAIDTTHSWGLEGERMLRNLLPLLQARHPDLQFYEAGATKTLPATMWLEWKEPKNFFSKILSKPRRSRNLAENKIDLFLTPVLKNYGPPSLVFAGNDSALTEKKKLVLKQTHFLCNWQAEMKSLTNQGATPAHIYLVTLPPSLAPTSFTAEEISAVRAQFSGRYLLTISNADHVRNVLKGYSLFKKRMQTQMRLVIISTKNSASQVQQLLKSYKYRDAVSVADEELTESLLSATDALVYPSARPHPALMNAMAAGRDLLLNQQLAGEPWFKNNALYFDAADPQSIAAKMMESYSGEVQKRQRENALVQEAATHTWEQAASQFHSALLKAGGKDL